MFRERERVGCPLEVAFMIGFEEKVSSRDEHFGESTKELSVDESAAVVPGFGPGVGEEEVESAYRCVREKPLHRVACLKP